MVTLIPASSPGPLYSFIPLDHLPAGSHYSINSFSLVLHPHYRDEESLLGNSDTVKPLEMASIPLDPLRKMFQVQENVLLLIETNS